MTQFFLPPYIPRPLRCLISADDWNNQLAGTERRFLSARRSHSSDRWRVDRRLDKRPSYESAAVQSRWECSDRDWVFAARLLWVWLDDWWSHWNLFSSLITREVSQNSLCVTTKLAQVTVERENGCLGLTLRGGSEMPIIVTNVRAYGPAYKTSRIKPGDRVLRVDNVSVFISNLLHNLIKFSITDLAHPQVPFGSPTDSEVWTQLAVLQPHHRIRSVGDANGWVLARPALDRNRKIDEWADGFGVEQLHAAFVRLQSHRWNSNLGHFHLEHHPSEYFRSVRCALGRRSDSYGRWDRRREHFIHAG